MTRSVENSRESSNITHLENRRKPETRINSLTHTYRTWEERNGAISNIWDPKKRLEFLLKPASIEGYKMECVDPRRCMSHLSGASAMPLAA